LKLHKLIEVKIVVSVEQVTEVARYFQVKHVVNVEKPQTLHKFSKSDTFSKFSSLIFKSNILLTLNKMSQTLHKFSKSDMFSWFLSLIFVTFERAHQCRRVLLILGFPAAKVVQAVCRRRPRFLHIDHEKEENPDEEANPYNHAQLLSAVNNQFFRATASEKLDHFMHIQNCCSMV